MKRTFAVLRRVGLATSPRATSSFLQVYPVPSQVHLPRFLSTHISHSSSKKSILHQASTSDIQSYVDALLGPILEKPLSGPLAIRALTHKSLDVSHSDSDSASFTTHSEKLTFIGRRALRTHLALHLADRLKDRPQQAQEVLSIKKCSDMLETTLLGGSVGKAWEVEKALQWRQVYSPNGKPSGLFKARGAAVEALIGAVYVEQGIEASSRVFHKLILPHLVFPSGV